MTNSISGPNPEFAALALKAEQQLNTVKSSRFDCPKGDNCRKKNAATKQMKDTVAAIAREAGELEKSNPALRKTASVYRQIAKMALIERIDTPSEGIGHFQGALEVMAALKWGLNNDAISSAAGRVLEGKNFKLYSKCGKPVFGEKPKDQKLFETGTKAIKIMADELGAEQPLEIMNQMEGKNALSKLKLLPPQA